MGDQTSRRAVLDQHRASRHRSLVLRFVGRKVILSTTDLHYAVGRLVALDAEDRLRLRVGDRDLLVPRALLVSIREVDEAVAEYVK